METIRVIVKSPGREAAPGNLPSTVPAMNEAWKTSATWGNQLVAQAASDLGPDLIILARESAQLGGAENLRVPYDLSGPIAIVARGENGGYSSIPESAISEILQWALLHDASVQASGLEYHGISEGDGYDRVYVQRQPERNRPARRYALVEFPKHSRIGFSWSFMGNGPLDLARCLLADALGLPDADPSGAFLEIENVYQTFAEEVIANLPKGGASWVIRGEEVLSWLRKHPPAPVCRTHSAVRDRNGACSQCEAEAPNALWQPPADL